MMFHSDHTGLRLDSLSFEELVVLFDERVRELKVDYIAKGYTVPANLARPFCKIVEVMNAMQRLQDKGFKGDIAVIKITTEQKK
jgi:hypothetical protein